MYTTSAMTTRIRNISAGPTTTLCATPEPQGKPLTGAGWSVRYYDTPEVGAQVRKDDMPQTNIPHIWVGQEVSVLTYSGGTKLEELDRRFLQEGETSGMDVKLEEVRGTLDDVTNLGIVITARGSSGS